MAADRPSRASLLLRVVLDPDRALAVHIASAVGWATERVRPPSLALRGRRGGTPKPGSEPLQTSTDRAGEPPT